MITLLITHTLAYTITCVMLGQHVIFAIIYSKCIHITGAILTRHYPQLLMVNFHCARGAPVRGLQNFRVRPVHGSAPSRILSGKRAR